MSTAHKSHRSSRKPSTNGTPNRAMKARQEQPGLDQSDDVDEARVREAFGSFSRASLLKTIDVLKSMVSQESRAA